MVSLRRERASNSQNVNAFIRVNFKLESCQNSNMRGLHEQSTNTQDASVASRSSFPFCLSVCVQDAVVFQRGAGEPDFRTMLPRFVFFLIYRNFVVLLWDLLGVWDGYSYFERNTKREPGNGAGRFPKCCF